MNTIDLFRSGSSSVSANVTHGVMERLQNYFLRYPNSRPKYACRFLHLDPKRYSATARVVKSRVRKAWGGANVQADPLKALTSVHRQTWLLSGGVPSGPVLSALLSAAGSGVKRDDTWFFSNNQNRQLNFRSKDLAIRVLPTTRRLEVLSRMEGTSGIGVRERFERVLRLTLEGRLPPDHDASCVARDLSWKLVPKERHRRFVFPSGPYYKLRFYEDTLGLVIQHDLSEAVNEQEAIEKMPPWILELIQVIIRLSDHQRETSQRLQQLAGLIHQQMSSVNANVKNCNR